MTDIRFQFCIKNQFFQIGNHFIGDLGFNQTILKFNDVVGELAEKTHLVIGNRDLNLIAVIERIIAADDVIDLVSRESIDQYFLL